MTHRRQEDLGIFILAWVRLHSTDDWLLSGEYWMLYVLPGALPWLSGAGGLLSAGV